MPSYEVLNELNRSSAKITETLDATLYEEGFQEWTIGEIHLVPREGSEEDRVVCKKIDKGGGRYEMVCKRPEEW